MLQLWIEERLAKFDHIAALQAVDAKWHLAYDSLGSLTMASFMPFGVLAAATFVIAGRAKSATVGRFVLAGMAILLPLVIPGGIHLQKLAYSDDSPPFVSIHFWMMAILTSCLIGAYSGTVCLAIVKRRQAARRNEGEAKSP
ncbi:MAG: hypothetical protein QM755_05720 [Luteolibacter sp.]